MTTKAKMSEITAAAQAGSDMAREEAEKTARRPKKLKRNIFEPKTTITETLKNEDDKPYGEKVVEDYEFFKLTTTTVMGRSDTSVTVSNKELRGYLRQITGNGMWYYDGAEGSMRSIVPFIRKFRKFAETWGTRKDYEAGKELEFAGCAVFLTKVEEAFKQTNDAAREMMDQNKITYDLLWYLFDEGQEVQFHDGHEWSAGTVTRTEYVQSMFATYFQVKLKVVKAVGNGFALHEEKARIRPFHDVQDMNTLSVRPLSEETRKKLTERGKIYANIGIGAHYRMYKGTLLRKGWWNDTEYRAAGRIMVDYVNMKHVDPDYFRNVEYNNDDDDDDSRLMDEIPENLLAFTSPIVYGFSFVSKKWGEMRVSDISEINFATDAFDKLVMDSSRKKLVMSLVKNASGTFSDIIEGKGGGCIFLLHGRPGLGKTLTAEATAEVLKRPLYSVSVGELGTDPDKLEERLRTILDMATSWNAVLLLDEADIFLETRSNNDIVRNAMVGIFLRLLEYHQGVLFLTTNRARSIDPAMRSRISIALAFEDHDATGRGAIWKNLLDKAGITGLDIDWLACHDLNGRQIKNTIRLAQAIAKEDGVDVSLSHIKTVIDHEAAFDAQMGVVI